MKKLSFLALAAVGLLLGACSSDKDVNEQGGDVMKGKTEGFFKINLNLPTAPVVSTRAWDEDASGTLNDGLDTEWAVEQVLLLIFEGTDESDAVLTQTIDLGTWSELKHTDSPNQITTREEYIANLKSAPATGNELFALAVINPNGIVAAGSADNKLVVKGSELTAPDLAAIKSKLAASADVNTNDFVKVSGSDKYFFMTNAVLSNAVGGTTKPAASLALQTLAPIEKSFIYETEAKATAGQAAADIYVERAVAKVTLDTTTDADYLKTSKLTASTGLTLSATLSGWSLDNTNKSSYIIRQVPSGLAWDLVSYSTAAGTDKYRFVGGNPVDPAVALYRTYWAEDPNYNIAWSAANFSNVEAAAITNKAVGDANPLYCFENTFTVAYQSFQNTTRAILAVKLISETSTNFYVIGADRKTLYTEADVKNKVKDYIMSQPSFIDWFNDSDPGKGGKGTLSGSTLIVNYDKTDDKAGKLSVVSVVIPAANTDAGADITITSSSTDVEGHDLSGVVSTLNTQLNNVERFIGGIAYYPIRIKHFGDDLTPWNNSSYPEYLTAPKESDIDDIYPDDARRDANYLGRYGMVRNNWYDLKIGEVLKIGTSTIPELTTHPDDELEDLYIKARINILSWAKRPQNWDLK